ncbi:hypothetical protein EDD18DRAFT_1153577 [Armillaria luteobubalina]|uniref:Zn(2)-C6 fungal-type domain-containing protein n=1 Tax=Armillaria luteobubalina TaxID=153913 RepID=A0AA39Q9J8_9AGAR|nr:hypothetical protein EDD18DRAFT_1153577 [Armillaria luteobubalina]
MDAEQPQPLSSSSTATTAPQVRSRITVVCAECKRLKLKCDRRNPCGSCTKRDTVARCIYSPAAAEKVDLHSLNNRLIQVESLLAQLTSGQFHSSFPTSNWAPPPPPSAVSTIPVSSSASLPITPQQPVCTPYTSLALPFEDLSIVWLDHLDLSDSHLSLRGTSPSTSTGSNRIKAESTSGEVASQQDIPDQSLGDRTTSSSMPCNLFSSSDPSIAQSLPSLNLYYATPSRNLNEMPSLPPFTGSTSPEVLPHSPNQKPRVTTGLLELLPPSIPSATVSYTLQSLLQLAEQSTSHTYPSTNWKHFRARASRMIATASRSTSSENSQRDRDRDKNRNRGGKQTVYFGARADNSLPGTPPSNATAPDDPHDAQPIIGESVPFFGALCAALALGSLESSRELDNPDAMQVDSARAVSNCSDPEYWYRLSVQALSVYEGSLAQAAPAAPGTKTKVKSDDYGLDYLVACLFQVIFLVKGGLGPALVDSAGTAAGRSGEGGNKRKREREREKQNDRVKNFGGVGGIVFPLVGKMVNIARRMGLARDPQEIPISSNDLAGSARKLKNKGNEGDGASSAIRGIANLFDVEMRRRIWWDVLYYDVFVSDALGHSPLIGDDFNTKLPVADVDEKVFSPVSTRIPIPKDLAQGSGFSRDGFRYFDVKCRLALLVRAIQRRVCAPDMGSNSRFSYGHGTSSTSKNGYGYTIDQAASMESEIRSWLNELTSCYHLDIADLDLSDPDPVLAAQRCEVSITAHRLIMKVYMPFLKKHASVSETVPAPHQASFGSVNAAHSIVRACSFLHSVWKKSSFNGIRPSSLSSAMFDFYPFARCLLDAAVVCAHSAIKQPMAMLANAALEDIDCALEVFKDSRLISQFGGGSGFGAGQDVNEGEAIKLLEELKVKAIHVRGNGLGSPSSLKRKHDLVEERDEEAGQDMEMFQEYADDDEEPHREIFNDLLAPQAPPELTPREPELPLPPFRSPNSNPSAMDPSKAVKDEKKKHAKRTYPAVGIRIRPGTDGKGSSPFTRRKLDSVSSSSSTTSSSGADNHQLPVPSPLASMSAPTSYQPPLLPSQHQPAALTSPFESDTSRSRSATVSHPPPPFTPRRTEQQNTTVNYPYPNVDGSRPDVARRYTMPGYSQTPQSQPLQIQSQGPSFAPGLYDRAGSYDSHPGYDQNDTRFEPGESYVPAQSPYLASSPFGGAVTTSSGPHSAASSPYTTGSTHVQTPTYAPIQSPPSMPVQSPIVAPQQYYAPTPFDSPTYASPFANDGGVNLGISPSQGQEMYERREGDVKPSLDRQSSYAQQYQGEPMAQSWPPPQSNTEHSNASGSYWQTSTAGEYKFYPNQ